LFSKWLSDSISSMFFLIISLISTRDNIHFHKTECENKTPTLLFLFWCVLGFFTLMFTCYNRYYFRTKSEDTRWFLRVAIWWYDDINVFAFI